MREPEPARAVRDRDLPGMQMAGEDEVERARGNPVDDAGVVAEEDPQVGLRIDEVLRMRAAVPVASRVDADDLDPPAAQLDRPALVGEERRRLELVERRLAGERVAAVAVVVVAEDGVAARQAGDELAQPRLAARAREEVAADADEVGRAGGGPLDRSLDGTRAARGNAEME